MLGLLHLTEGRERPSLRRIQIGGLTLLEGTLVWPAGASARRRRRRALQMKKLLSAGGVRRLIVPEGETIPEELAGFKRVDPLPFYRDMADLLALECLREHGVEPRRAVVALSAPRLSPELDRTAKRLLPWVRQLLLDVPGEGPGYAQRLHREFGVPVTPAGGADVTILFAHGGGRRGRVLELSEERLDLCGMEVAVPRLSLPAGCERQMLAALWEQGLISRDRVSICRIAALPSPVPLDK